MSISDLLILGLATMRLSKMLADEHGPWAMLEKLRYLLGVRYDKFSERYGKNMVANGIICVFCNSVWIGLFFAALYTLFPSLAVIVALPFALSGVAILPRLKYN